MSKNAEQRLLKARARISADQRFASLSGLIHAGTVSINTVFEGRPVKTTLTNGWDVIFNPDFLEKAQDDQIGYELLHCLMHKAFDHFRAYRALSWDGLPFLLDVDTIEQAQARFVQLRDSTNLSEADTELLKKCVFERTKNELILGAVLDASVNAKLRPVQESKTRGVRLEYRMPAESPIETDLNSGKSISGVFYELKGDGFQPRGDDTTHVFPLGSPEFDANLQKVQEVLLSLSTSATMFGSEAGDLDLQISRLTVPKLSWRERLRNLARTISRTNVPTRTSWASPHRRFVYQGKYFPSMVSENIGRLVVAVDTSGSCVSDTTRFLSEVYGLLVQMNPEGVDLLWVDSDVAGHDVLEPGQYESLLGAVHPKGGGGTDMTSIWKYIEAKKIEACAVIVLTDGYTPWPEAQALKTPTWWVINTTVNAPVGTTIHMEDSDRFIPNY